LFKQIIGLNTYSLPFLALPAKNQRDVVEELLGITQLSEKAEKLKELLKITKDLITEEEFKVKAIKETNEKVQKSIDELHEKSSKWDIKHENNIEELRNQIEKLMDIDIDADIVLNKNYEKYNSLNSQLLKSKREKSSKEITLKDLIKRKNQYQIDLDAAKEHNCPTCHQSVHDKQQEEIQNIIEGKLLIVVTQIDPLEKEISEVSITIKNTTTEISNLGEIKKPIYSNIDDAYNHRTKLDTLADRLEKAMFEKNPLDEHIIGQQESLLQKIDLENLQQMNVLREHQEFLLKLLTNKDSAVRKKIIDQNLNYLNHRLASYVDKLGLPHNVTFMNDLTIMILDHGRDIDFENLSRGERTRLILGLSFAFRDVYENLTGTINLFYIDEILDSGMDGMGLENSLEILKKMSRENNKSIWLVSHREELQPRVNSTLLVVKENGFSSLNVGEQI